MLLLAVFAAAALYAGYFCLFRAPEIPAEDAAPREEADELAEEVQDPEALARAAHLSGRTTSTRSSSPVR